MLPVGARAFSRAVGSWARAGCAAQRDAASWTQQYTQQHAQQYSQQYAQQYSVQYNGGQHGVDSSGPHGAGQRRWFQYGDGRDVRRATTILCVRKDGQVVMIGDGQVSQGDTVVKPNAKKVRRIGDTVMCGFAGSAADGLTLLERLETKLEEHPGQLMRAAVELAKVWRQDKALRFLQAELLVADGATTLTVSGNGDVLEPYDGIMAIGSGGRYAMAAARALLDVPGMDALTVARRSMKIAADMCIYTNSNFVEETLAASSEGDGAGNSSSSSSSTCDAPQ